MAGRYSFSLPGPHQRDGWFRVGQIDVTTTVLITGLGVLSMFLYAISPSLVSKGAFEPGPVRDGEIWRLVLWPLVNPPVSLWMVIGLLFFWYFGRFVEEQMGRIPYTRMTIAATIIPALVVTLANTANDPEAVGVGRWSTSSYSVDLLGIAALVIFVTSNPGARFFFNIPGWVIGAVAVGLRVLNTVGLRQWATLLLLGLVLLVTVFSARQHGMAQELSFIPNLAERSGRGRGRGRGHGRTGGRGGPARRSGGGGGRVVRGPWSGSETSVDLPSMPPGPALTPLEQAELDTLLELIHANGIESLNDTERARLNELSRRLRGN